MTNGNEAAFARSAMRDEKGEIWFIKGRLKFGGSKNAAPFPSAIVIFRERER